MEVQLDLLSELLNPMDLFHLRVQSDCLLVGGANLRAVTRGPDHNIQLLRKDNHFLYGENSPHIDDLP